MPVLLEDKARAYQFAKRMSETGMGPQGSGKLTRLIRLISEELEKFEHLPWPACEQCARALAKGYFNHMVGHMIVSKLAEYHKKTEVESFCENVAGNLAVGAVLSTGRRPGRATLFSAMYGKPQKD